VPYETGCEITKKRLQCAIALKCQTIKEWNNWLILEQDV
jgi:hypothetical protein